jgi:outer membrane lipopolysaccharide assembly protein LptE/RlpB
MGCGLLGGLLAAALLLSGCGYRLVGAQGAGKAGATALWIGPVVDEGAEPLFGATLARSLNREAVNRAGFSLAGRGAASRFLAVRVDSVTERGASYSAPAVIREYVLTADVTVTLTGPEDKPIWKGKGIRADREFLSGASVRETENNKQVALDLLAGDLSREILRRVSLVLEDSRP